MWSITAAKVRGQESINFIEFSHWCASEEEAEAEVSLFPKYLRIRKIRGSENGKTVPVLSFRIDFAEQKDNPKNETGYKRLRKALEVIGSNFSINTGFSNAATMNEILELAN